MNKLEERIQGARMKDIQQFLQENESEMTKTAAFSEYMRQKFREKGLLQQDVFLQADIPERYGYKLISMEKHTKQRDIIIRICYAAKFTLEETQTSLHLYRMPELYPEFPRDALIMVAFNDRPGDVIDLNSVLKKNGMDPLRSSGTTV